VVKGYKGISPMNRDQLLQHMLREMEAENIGKRRYARKHNINDAHLSRIFSGKIQNPTDAFLNKIGFTRVRQANGSYSYIQNK
jgi:hypothetical protein